MTTVYFAGGEDEAMVQVGGGTVVTTAGTFRSSFARCALQVPGGTNRIVQYWQTQEPYSASQFWQSVRCNASANPSAGSTLGMFTLGWADANGVLRLILQPAGVGPNTFNVYKVDATGAQTSLGATNFTISFGLGSIVDKFDTFINYAVSGQFSIYFNGALIYNFSGDVTTNGVTSLAYSRLGLWQESTSKFLRWSELIVSDSDTRSWGLQTFQPVANGNTHNFDTGTPAAANVNEVTLDDTTYDGSTTAGQIDQYTIPALVTGYFPIAFGVSARMAKGASGPSKMDLCVRVGGTDYWSADQVLGVSLLNYQNWWLTNPNTSAPWTVVPDNIGLKSVT